jgi:hypothetical protein
MAQRQLVQIGANCRVRESDAGDPHAMLLLLLCANLASQSPEPQQRPAQALVRIERASTATEAAWSRSRAEGYQRREVHRVDEFGRPILLRLIEHQ